MRLLQVWDDDDVHEVEYLRANAEAMHFGSIKNCESKDKAKLKVT
jgi:hypothetical protein